MKIKVVRQYKGAHYSGHVFLYAWSESEDEYYSRNGKKIYAIKFDFYQMNGSSIEVCEPDSYYEDHNSVIINSEKSFKDFCAEMIISPFSNGKSFHYSEMNCVHSVKFALETAKINIDFNDTMSCKHLIGCCCCPTTLTTPRELIAALKEEKNKALLEVSHQANEKTPLMDEAHATTKNYDEQREQIQQLENAAIRDERIAMSSLLAAFPCILSWIGSSVATNILASNINPLIPIIIGPVGAMTCGIGLPLCASSFFYKRANTKSNEIEIKYQETYGDAIRAPSGRQMNQN